MTARKHVCMHRAPHCLQTHRSGLSMLAHPSSQATPGILSHLGAQKCGQESKQASKQQECEQPHTWRFFSLADLAGCASPGLPAESGGPGSSPSSPGISESPLLSLGAGDSAGPDLGLQLSLHKRSAFCLVIGQHAPPKFGIGIMRPPG